MESAVEQICREGGARVSTNVMVRNLDIAQSNTDTRRLKDCQSSVESSWLWMQRWFLPTTETGDHSDGPTRQTALPSSTLERESKTHTRNCANQMGGQDRLSLQAKLVLAGPPKQKTSCNVWHIARHCLPHRSSERARRQRGTDGGAACWHVPRRKLSQSLCWKGEDTQARAGVFRQCTKC